MNIIIGRINKRNPKEYIMYNMISNNKFCVTEKQAMQIIAQGMCENATLVNDKIVGSNGAIKELPLYDTNGAAIKVGKRMYILSQAINNSNNTIAFRIADINFNKIQLQSYTNTIKIIKKYGCVNGKVSHRNSKEYISAIKGEFKREHIDTAVRRLQSQLQKAYTKKNDNEIQKEFENGVNNPPPKEAGD